MSEEIWGNVLDKIADSLDRIATILEKKEDIKIKKFNEVWNKLSFHEQQATLNRKEPNEQ
jgi:hypothetical protein